MKHLVVAAVVATIALQVTAMFEPRCRMPNSSAAIGTLRTYYDAQREYFASHGRYGSDTDLIAADLLDRYLTDGSIHDAYVYRFTVDALGEHFQARATPTQERHWWDMHPDDKHFLVTDAGVIRWRWSEAASDLDIGISVK